MRTLPTLGPLRGGRSIAAAAALAIAAFGPAPASAIIIDSFDHGPVDISANLATPLVQSVVDAPGIIGGQRETTVEYYNPTSTAPDNVRLRVDFADQNNFSHSQDAGVAGISTFTYDGMDGDPNSIDYSGLGGVDLTEGGLADRFIFTVIFADQSVSEVLGLRVYTDATHYSERFVSFATPINSPSQINLLFSDFNVGAGAAGAADLTNIGAIILAIDGRFENGLDVRLDMLETLVIPEPATISLFALGITAVAGLGRRRYRLRKA